MFQSAPAAKKLTLNQILGQRGEMLVGERVLSMGFSFHSLNRLETGIDGMLELRDPQTHRMLGQWLGVQAKATQERAYSYETEIGFDYLLDNTDLDYWRESNIPLILVVVRISDASMYWKPLDAGNFGEPRRLAFDKRKDVFDSSAADALAAMLIDRTSPGSYVPPMLSGDPLHLNLIRMILPPTIFVARSPFGSGREAVKEMLTHAGPHHFDWVVKNRTYWSFRDPRTCTAARVIDEGDVDEVETPDVSLPDDEADEHTFIDLLRRSVEAQVRDDLAFDKESRSLFFRAAAVLQKRRYDYRSLHQAASADVVSIYEKQGRSTVMRHHAFSPRYQRIGDEWFISVAPTFVFTTNGFQPHPVSSLLLAGKKKLERNGAIRGQIFMWRHLLVSSGEPAAADLFGATLPADPRPRIRFEPLEPTVLPVAVPEAVWRTDDPHAADLASPETLL